MDMNIIVKLYNSGDDMMIVPLDDVFVEKYHIARYGNGWIRLICTIINTTIPFGLDYCVTDTIVSVKEIMEA